MSVQSKSTAGREVKITSAQRVPAHTKEITEKVNATKTFTPFARGMNSVTHHLFKAGVAEFLKNDSYKKDDPTLIPMKHEHIYHTCDSMGRPIIHTGFVGGHCHEIKVVQSESGEMTIECGPPLKKEIFKGRDGRKKTRFVPVKFFDKYAGDEDGNESGVWKVDAHVHDMIYMGSETWTGEQMQARSGKTAAPMDDGLAAARATIQKAGVTITE